MFDYTKAAVAQTIDDLKKVLYYVGVATQTVYLAYILYALVAETGIFVINLLLFLLSFAYFVFHLITTKFGKDPDAKECKRLKSNGKEIMKWTKRSLRLITIIVAFVEIFSAKTPDTLTVVMAAFMAIGWLLEILFDLIVKILNKRYRFIMDGLEMDIDEITKPFKNVGNFFKKMTGQEVAPEKEPTKNQVYLREKVLVLREEKSAEKENEKIRRAEERKQKKQAEKQNKLALKQSTKAEKALLKAAKKQERLQAKEEKESNANREE